MTRLTLSLLAFLAVLALGCQDDLVQPDADVLLDHKGQPHGKPGDGGGEEPSGPDGRIIVFVGYPAVVNSRATTGDISAVGAQIVPVGAVVGVPILGMDIGYFRAQAGFAVCFPETLVRANLSLTEEAGTGRADFTLSALALDGATSVQYVLTLDGGTYSDAWPVPQGTTSAFDADTWTLTSSGKGKRRQGCTGTGTFGNTVRVELRHLTPTTVNPGTTPFLASPFSGTPPMTNPFDHTGSGDGLSVNFRGDTVSGVDGHVAYDWAMPEGTPLRATAGGVVVWSDVDPPVYCARLGRIVDDQLFVAIEHLASDGQRFATVYKHLSRADVQRGDPVATGDVIGLSGNTGCSSGPHLHLSIRGEEPGGVDFVGRYAVRVDPYGWSGTGGDPWVARLDGALNQFLWLPGEAPAID